MHMYKRRYILRNRDARKKSIIFASARDANTPRIKAIILASERDALMRN